jgi:uncharacterized membrane protein YczE
MKKFFIRLLNVVFGLFLYALGIVTTIKANIGYAPWDVFHVGLSTQIGLSIGTVSIVTGLALVIIVALMGEKMGLGTILNMILIGVFIDVIYDLIPMSGNMVIGVIMLIAGLFIISTGSYFYIKSGFGAGPRDSLMVALARKTKLPAGVCRGVIELSVTLAGWFLGGMVGIGTIISAIGIGFCIQIVFKIFKFDATAVQHETLGNTYAALGRVWKS